MRRRLALLLLLGLVPASACVPADDALPLGSVSFHYRPSALAAGELFTDEGFAITIDRALLSLDTTTIGQSGNDSRCAYRGRAAQRNVVFDVMSGLTQTFNGVEPDSCPDVGFILAPPTDVTLPGPGATGDDVISLADGEPAHAFVAATATSIDGATVYRLALRFDSARTTVRWGGCRDGVKGIAILPNRRVEKTIQWEVEAIFRESLGGAATLRFAPFRDADADGDRVITMAELDALSLASAHVYSDFYAFEDGSVRGTLGDFVRRQMRYAFTFDANGVCIGTDER